MKKGEEGDEVALKEARLTFWYVGIHTYIPKFERREVVKRRESREKMTPFA